LVEFLVNDFSLEINWNASKKKTLYDYFASKYNKIPIISKDEIDICALNFKKSC